MSGSSSSSTGTQLQLSVHQAMAVLAAQMRSKSDEDTSTWRNYSWKNSMGSFLVMMALNHVGRPSSAVFPPSSV